MLGSCPVHLILEWEGQQHQSFAALELDTAKACQHRPVEVSLVIACNCTDEEPAAECSQSVALRTRLFLHQGRAIFEKRTLKSGDCK